MFKGRGWVKIDPHELEILNCISPKQFRLLLNRYRHLVQAGESLSAPR